jgi:hypothetical protein
MAFSEAQKIAPAEAHDKCNERSDHKVAQYKKRGFSMGNYSR